MLEVSQGWGTHVDCAADGTDVETVVLEARACGAWPLHLEHREAARSAMHLRRSQGGRYFGASRIAPSRRITSPLSMSFSTICLTSFA